MEKIRAFIAVDIENKEFSNQITEIQKNILDIGADIKPVPPENIHLTLRFLGEVETTLMEKIIDILRLIDFQPFEIRLKGTGAFPNMRKINVIWIGLERGHEELTKLSRVLETHLKNLAFHKIKKDLAHTLPLHA